jgi:hypothetical protein
MTKNAITAYALTVVDKPEFMMASDHYHLAGMGVKWVTADCSLVAPEVPQASA